MDRTTRKTTNRILEDVENGLLDKDVLILALLNYLSEAEVVEMAESNYFYETTY